MEYIRGEGGLVVFPSSHTAPDLPMLNEEGLQRAFTFSVGGGDISRTPCAFGNAEVCLHSCKYEFVSPTDLSHFPNATSSLLSGQGVAGGYQTTKRTKIKQNIVVQKDSVGHYGMCTNWE